MSLHPDVKARRVALTVIVASVLTVAATVAAGLAPAVRTRLGWNRPPADAYVRGAVIDVPRSIYERADHTLLVFASGTCGACLRSRSAVQAVAADLRGSSTKFVLLTPASMRSDQQMLASALGLAVDEYLALDLSKLQVKNLPTVVLVDRTGRVLYAREGLIDMEAQESIRRAITAARL